MATFQYSEQWQYNEPFPNNCPLCKNFIHPKLFCVYTFQQEDYKIQIRACFVCPNSNCEEPFIACYEEMLDSNGNHDELNFMGLAPFSYSSKVFSDLIKDISPNFVKTYHQAQQAEDRKLDEICGIGYRKAFEFLIKDFLIHKNPQSETEIKQSVQLQKVITDHVTDDKVKFVASRISWLGNDHAHYIKKWEDKDINDLKRLIDLLIYWISSELELEHYKSEMPEGKR